jgi:hypothetical protein
MMSVGLNLILAGAAVFVMCVTAAAAAKRQTNSWNYYHFDGRAFAAGRSNDGSAFVAVRDGIRPVMLTRAARIDAVVLPPGKGAIAGICYIQSSGGKLVNASGFVPSPGMTVQISANNRVVATAKTDEHGYFAVVLDTGGYVVACGPAAVDLKVENGKTTLVPLRTGKRMVD